MDEQLVDLGHITITYNRLWIIVFTLLIFVGCSPFCVTRASAWTARGHAEPRHGRVHGDQDQPHRRADVRAWLRHRGLAGVALSQIDNVSPNLGQGYIIDSFMVVVFGGVGNLWGTLVGAFTLGIANKFLDPMPARCSPRSPSWC